MVSSRKRCAMQSLLSIATVSFALASGDAAHAQANDDWADRTPITTLPFAVVHQTSGVTVDPSDPLPPCQGPSSSSTGTLWFGYTTGTTPEFLTLRVGNFQVGTVIAVYTGAPGAFRLASGGCARAAGSPNNAQLAGVRLAPNTEYSILLSAQSPPGNVDFTVATAIRYAVTKTADTADGTCDADCSLREALAASNLTAGAVIVPAGTYTLSIDGSNEDDNATGDLDVRNDVGIHGAGMGATVVDANRIDRVFDVASLVQDANTLILGDLTLTGGDANVAPRRGGGVRDLSLSPGFLGLERVAIVDNIAQQSGAGLDTNSAGTVRESRFSRNDTNGAGGGALLFNPQNRDFDVESSTFDANDGGSSGGGLQTNGSLRITNSTISGNIAQAGAGMRAFNGPLVMASTTVAFNTGEGLFLDSPVTYELYDNVVAGNSGTDCLRISGTLVSHHNHVQNATPLCSLTGPGDVVGTDPELDPLLAGNGGPTPTHALAATSPVIDAGDPSGCAAADGLLLATDQRGEGFPRQQGPECDKGAFEQPSALFFADGFEQ